MFKKFLYPLLFSALVWVGCGSQTTNNDITGSSTAQQLSQGQPSGPAQSSDQDVSDSGDATSTNPVANFTIKPSRGDVTTEFTFNASGSHSTGESIIKYVWHFGDGNTGEGKTVTHTYQK